MGRLSTAITTEVLSADPTVSALPDTAPSAVDAVVSAAGYVAPVFSALDALPEVVPSGLVPVASVFAVDSISAALLDDVDSISSDSVSSDGSDPVYYGPFVAPASVPRRIPWSPHASGRTYIELETLEDTTLSRYFQARTRSSRLAAAWTYVHLRVKQHNSGVPTRLFYTDCTAKSAITFSPGLSEIFPSPRRPSANSCCSVSSPRNSSAPQPPDGISTTAPALHNA